QASHRDPQERLGPFSTPRISCVQLLRLGPRAHRTAVRTIDACAMDGLVRGGVFDRTRRTDKPWTQPARRLLQYPARLLVGLGRRPGHSLCAGSMAQVDCRPSSLRAELWRSPRRVLAQIVVGTAVQLGSGTAELSIR